MVAAVVGIGELSFYRTRDGLLDGRPWVEGIATDYDHHQGPATLARMLQAACYVVIAFLQPWWGDTVSCSSRDRGWCFGAPGKG